MPGSACPWGGQPRVVRGSRAGALRCRALREAACLAACRLRVACLPRGVGGPELEQHAAAMLCALRGRPHLEELVLDHAADSGARPATPCHALAYRQWQASI